MWNWLLNPFAAAAPPSFSAVIAWHGCFMALAWVVLMPMALAVARFYKITPGQDWPRVSNSFWFRSHRWLGYATGIATVVAMAGFLWRSEPLILWQRPHAMTGWALLALALFQVVGSLFRGTHGGPIDQITRKPVPPERWPGDHFSLTRRRIIFEYSHKYTGYALIPLTVWQVASGLQDAGAPNWISIMAGLWAVILAAAFIRLQAAGRCIDTYQAIWGLDETLPGYRREPIGWGITRVHGPYAAKPLTWKFARGKRGDQAADPLTRRSTPDRKGDIAG
ncbi:MAG: cytochrome b [Burkholderiales bacterium]|nr:cytochrome b [Burkholderiales bacterium]